MSRRTVASVRGMKPGEEIGSIVSSQSSAKHEFGFGAANAGIARRGRTAVDLPMYWFAGPLERQKLAQVVRIAGSRRRR